MDRNKFHYMSGAALFAGIMAVLSQFAFPVGAVPVTLQTFVCAFAGGVLGWKWGAVSISVWLLLGALGVPILTMGKAGVGIFLSPVGGYYIGFILMAGFSGIYLKEKTAFSPREYLRFWGSSLLRVGDSLVHDVLFSWFGERNAALDSPYDDRFPLYRI